MFRNNSGKVGTAASLVLAAIILGGVFIFMFVLNSNTTKEIEVNASSDIFEIKGMYGTSIKIGDITSVELKDAIPEVGRKTNGAGLGETKKGYFEVAGMGECLLFTSSDKGPFLFIDTNSLKIIMNFKDGEKTRQVYNDLLGKWNK